MTTVAVIGAGDIGGATAHALAASDAVGRVLIVDAAAKAAAGKALDIQQSGAVAGFHTRLEGTDDLSRVTGCAVCIVADRFGSVANEWAGDEGLAMLNRLVPALSGAAIVFAGASQTSLIEMGTRELRLGTRRMVGSAPEAFAAAARAMVALEAGCSPAEVSLAVLGKPPRGLVVPWSDASIGGHAVERRLDAVQLTRIEARVERLWPPGPYALGLAAATVATAILTSARRSHAVLAVLDGAFGLRNGVGVIQSVLSPAGIARTWTPSLTAREHVKVMTALGGGMTERE